MHSWLPFGFLEVNCPVSWKTFIILLVRVFSISLFFEERVKDLYNSLAINWISKIWSKLLPGIVGIVSTVGRLP